VRPKGSPVDERARLARLERENAELRRASTRLSSSRCVPKHFATKDHARRAVARFIDAYNHRRPHSSCEMLSPVAYELLLAQRAADAAHEDRAA
jgi:transposase InsO family protein